MKLDKDGPLTLTYQMTEMLRSRISTQLSPGDRLPTERQLVAEFDVSAITVKNAMDTLVHEGLIHRRRGKGTFVAEKKISSDTRKLTSATELFAQSGHASHVMILECMLLKADAYLSGAFEFPENEPVIRLVRLRSLDGEAYSHEINFLPVKFFPDIDSRYRGGSLYAYMEANYGIIPSRSEETYKVISLDSQLARLMNQDRGSAAFFMFSKVFDQHDRLVSLEESVYRGDKFELKVNANAYSSRGQRIIEADQGESPLARR